MSSSKEKAQLQGATVVVANAMNNQHCLCHSLLSSVITGSNKNILRKQKNLLAVASGFQLKHGPHCHQVDKARTFNSVTLSQQITNVTRRCQKPLDQSEHKHLKQLETLKLVLHQPEGTAHKYFKPKDPPNLALQL